MKKNICIIDDHEIIRAGIKKLVNKTEIFEVIYEFSSNTELLNQPLKHKVDLIIQDLDLENGCDLSQLELLKHKFPETPVLVYTMHQESMYGLACLKYNISGYLTKDKPASELIKAIKLICTGKRYFTEELTTLLSQQYLNQEKAITSKLSQREYEVFQLIGEGNTLVEIAKKLFINTKTVSTYRRRILTKLELTSTNQIIHYYLSQKIATA